MKVLFPAADVGAVKLTSVREELRGKGTILVVDDEEVVRKVAKTALGLYGYTVILAEDGESAVTIYRHRSSEIDLVLLDLLMPHMGGEETFRQLRVIRPDVKVLLCSGHSDGEALRRFAGKSLAGFLKKPYTAAELGGRIKRILTGSGE
jgi:two-component system, cell cycle sensor histidine kinase and response regulator CckA